MEIVPANEVGMNADALRRAERLLEDLHATGKYPALQVCVRRHGEIVLHRAFGQFRPISGGATRAVDLDTRFAIFSISKAVTSALVHVLLDQNRVHVDDPVHWYIPEFAQHGKELVTLRHVMTHQAGIPMVLWNLSDARIRDWDGIIAQICAQRPWHPPGRRVGYHMISGGYVLGEVVQRVTGLSLQDALREWIREPLGMETFTFGVDPQWWDRTACSERVDDLPPRPLLTLVNRVLDVDVEQALAVMNRPAVFESVIPAANVVGTAEETSRFFQMLLDGGRWRDQRVLSAEQVRRATIEQVLAVADWTLFLTPQRYSLGFMLGRKKTEFNIFGRHSEETFGHLGFSRNLAWADPARGIAGGLLTSGKPVRPTREIAILREFQNTLRDACR